jgi:hypothetical protein
MVFCGAAQRDIERSGALLLLHAQLLPRIRAKVMLHSIKVLLEWIFASMYLCEHHGAVCDLR